MGNCNTCYCDPSSEFSSNNNNNENAPVQKTLIDKNQRLQFTQNPIITTTTSTLPHPYVQITNLYGQQSPAFQQTNIQDVSQSPTYQQSFTHNPNSYSIMTGQNGYGMGGDSLNNSQNLMQMLNQINQQNVSQTSTKLDNKHEQNSINTKDKKKHLKSYRSDGVEEIQQNQSMSLSYQKQSSSDSSYQYGIQIDFHQLVSLQAMMRGLIARKYYAFKKAQRINSVVNARYFTLEEYQESFQIKPFGNFCGLKNRKILQQPYLYKSSGAIYEGEWMGNMRSGFGTMSWPDGAKYIGNWSFNRAWGKGQFIHVEGDVYDGEWVNDRASGYGVYQHQNGALYQGQWRDDQQNGHGYEKWMDGSSYLGGYKEGLKEGLGIYKWSDGSDYEGEWAQNKINGIGVYSWLDGRKYEGQWKNNNMDGIGYYQWADGRRYEGEYYEDKKHGFGIYHWSDGRVYIGYWSYGKQHGLGTFKSPEFEGLKYGLWEGGKRIQWFEEEDIILAISRGEYDYTQLFQNAQSVEQLVKSTYEDLQQEDDGDENQSDLVDQQQERTTNGFNPPQYFEETFRLIKIRLGEIKIQIKSFKDKNQ